MRTPRGRSAGLSGPVLASATPPTHLAVIFLSFGTGRAQARRLAYRAFGLAKIRRKGKWPYRLQISTPAPPWGTLTKRVDFGRPVLPAPPPTTAEKKNDISEYHLVLLYLGFFSPKFSTFLSLLPHLGLLPWGACSEVFACLRVAKKDATWPKP